MTELEFIEKFEKYKKEYEKASKEKEKSEEKPEIRILFVQKDKDAGKCVIKHDDKRCNRETNWVAAVGTSMQNIIKVNYYCPCCWSTK